MSVDMSKVIWYTRTRGPVAAGPSVTINKAGRLVINDEAMELFGEIPEAVQLGLYDAGRGKISVILQAAAKSDTGSLAVTKQGKSKYSVNSAKFLRDLGHEKMFGSSSSKLDFDHEHSALVATF